jgi:hypothetical protein
MTIDKSFLEKIEQMAEAKLHNLNGIDYATRQLHEIKQPTANELLAHTLTAVKDYFESLEGEMKSAVVHVFSHDYVAVKSKLDSIHRNREHYLAAGCIYKPFAFDTFISAERFNIALQSQFVNDTVTANILKITGNITSEAKHQTLDDGVSQTVTARTGIAKVENVVVPNPVILRPFRTFAEIEQPASQFIFRMKSGGGEMPSCALYEADGGAWKLAAIQCIKEWLVDNLPKGTAIIA